MSTPARRPALLTMSFSMPPRSHEATLLKLQLLVESERGLRNRPGAHDRRAFAAQAAFGAQRPATRSVKRSPWTMTWLRRASAARISSRRRSRRRSPRARRAIAGVAGGPAAATCGRAPGGDAATGPARPGRRCGSPGRPPCGTRNSRRSSSRYPPGPSPPCSRRARPAGPPNPPEPGGGAASRPQAASISAMASNMASSRCGSGALTMAPRRGLAWTRPVAASWSSASRIGCVRPRSAPRAGSRRAATRGRARPRRSRPRSAAAAAGRDSSLRSLRADRPAPHLPDPWLTAGLDANHICSTVDKIYKTVFSCIQALQDNIAAHKIIAAKSAARREQ